MFAMVTASGQTEVCLLLLGMLATTAGAALEITLSVAYATAQQARWRWGKREHPSKAPGFYTLAVAAVAIAAAVTATGLDPVQLSRCRYPLPVITHAGK